MDKINVFFAIAPFAIFAGIILITYAATRQHGRKAVPVGQSLSCVKCGRRGNREHMLPVREQGTISWYCPRCSATLAKM